MSPLFGQTVSLIWTNHKSIIGRLSSSLTGTISKNILLIYIIYDIRTIIRHIHPLTIFRLTKYLN